MAVVCNCPGWPQRSQQGSGWRHTSPRDCAAAWVPAASAGHVAATAAAAFPHLGSARALLRTLGGGSPQGGGGAGAWLMPRPACGPRGPAPSVSLTPFALMAHGHERKPVGKPGALSRACPAGPLPLAPGLRQGLRPRAGPGPRESYKVTGSLSRGENLE